MDKEIMISDFRKATDITPNIKMRMRKNQEILLIVLGRICRFKECDFGDVVEYIYDNESSEGDR
ncbi:helix-turn-helix domain-containing protein [Thomasclavelia cocleata]|uniref:helix-turn-helix domain-containing protein n=1 Tax=Thomasclavelia cocleata TaxID=69824 RepID=UPI00272E932A|nr:helix-turn-helix transcriptional regulator [Thomasclavelia cocleata]